MLHAIIGMIIFFLINIIFSIPFSMIILSLFFGIPKTIMLKKKMLLNQTATIKPYIITISIWFPICFIAIFLLFKLLPSFGVFSIFGLSFAMVRSINCLHPKHYKANMKELFQTQSKFDI